MNVMKSERNETLKVVDGFEIHFHKLLKNYIQRWCCTFNTCKSFFKFNNNDICMDDGLRDYRSQSYTYSYNRTTSKSTET